jgi:formylglycine-generating enzyme required for sulfatase activity
MWSSPSPLSRLAALGAILCATSDASALAINWVDVGGAGNACDAQPQGCFGAVATAYRIGRTEVTNAQYAEFLNAVAKADANGLYHASMASSGAGFGGITRSGSAGSYAYAAVADRAQQPVNYVSFYDALRFANWLHNGQPVGAQGPGTTETGAYAITASGIAGNTIARSPGALVALASEDEWYKAAYYDAPGARYFDYPAGADAAPTCAAPGAAANTANCGIAAGTPGAGRITAVGGYPGAASPSGTLDQGGNVWEWNEAVVDGANRGLRGGSFHVKAANLAAATRSYTVPDAESSIMGFRVVSLPEPDGAVSLALGAFALAGLRGARRRRLAAALLLTLPCAAAADDDPTQALLGSRRGGSFTWDYCEGKPDATPLPPDPRTLAQPGTNAGKAVHMNTYWKNCHVDPVAVQEVGAAETCGELRERFYRGELLLDTGSAHPAGLFTGTDPDSNLLGSTFSADAYNQVWMVWGGYVQRPQNFDELAAQRYGSGFGPNPNPYPLPGEDPNLTQGGSGKLPEMFTQLRGGQYGEWTGEITVTCHACHSGAVGTGAPGDGPGLTYGGGSSLADLNLFLRDFLALGYEASAAVVLNLNHTRGRNNASLINLAFAAAGGTGSGPNLAGVITSGSTADMDTPAWWNMGHRPAKFVDGVFPMDSPRVDAVFYAPTIGITPEGQTWMRGKRPRPERLGRGAEVSRVPVPDRHRARRAGSSAVPHARSVGARAQQPGAPARGQRLVRELPRRVRGALCERSGVPRLARARGDRRLSGAARHHRHRPGAPAREQRVGSDRGPRELLRLSPDQGHEQDCGPQNAAALRGSRELGYLAPPLYGVWATAPTCTTARSRTCGSC